MTTIPVSVVIPTKDRPAMLRRTIDSILSSSAVPDEFVIVDASAEPDAAALQARFDGGANGPRLIALAAVQTGAAAQRNQALTRVGNDHVLFCDDDILCEPDCIERLWQALQSERGIGGVSAMIVNQSYARPGRALRTVLSVLGAREMKSYAGRMVGPAIGFLPEKSEADEPVAVEWLNTTCTLYRRDLLPDPPFDAFFTGYSLREDVALSLRVGRKARLANVPAARIHHDSQPGAHKSDVVALSRMDTVSRHYVMTEVMRKRSLADHGRLILWELCQLAICAIRERGGAPFWRTLRGRVQGMCDIARRTMRRDPA